MIKDHGIFSVMIILLILITLSLDSEWILLGENYCWTLLGLKGLKECFFFLISVCHDIDQWPFPEAGHTLQLPLMGNVMQV